MGIGNSAARGTADVAKHLMTIAPVLGMIGPNEDDNSQRTSAWQMILIYVTS